MVQHILYDSPEQPYATHEIAAIEGKQWVEVEVPAGRLSVLTVTEL